MMMREDEGAPEEEERGCGRGEGGGGGGGGWALAPWALAYNGSKISK